MHMFYSSFIIIYPVSDERAILTSSLDTHVQSNKTVHNCILNYAVAKSMQMNVGNIFGIL